MTVCLTRIRHSISHIYLLRARHHFQKSPSETPEKQRFTSRSQRPPRKSARHSVSSLESIAGSPRHPIPEVIGIKIYLPKYASRRSIVRLLILTQPSDRPSPDSPFVFNGIQKRVTWPPEGLRACPRNTDMYPGTVSLGNVYPLKASTSSSAVDRLRV